MPAAVFSITKQFKNKSFWLFCLLSFLSVRCSNNADKSKLILQKENQKNPTSITKATSLYLSQDTLKSFLYRCKIIKANKRACPPFDKLEYNKVIAHNYEGTDGEHVFKIVQNNILASKIKLQRQLNQKQADDLTDWLGAISTYGGTYAFCFEPKLGIVFYYNNKITANISISIACNFLDSSIPIPATKVKTIEISKDYIYPAKGFSETGRQNLISLAKELNFGVQ